MFDNTYENRLASWRDFRESLETVDNPFQEVINNYKKAPYVSIHTDPWTREMWPNPWELINENQYDDFCCVLGMCYSLQLTDRFKGSKFEIHIGIDNETSSTHFLLFVDDTVFGLEDSYVDKSKLPTTYSPQEIYQMPNLH